MSVVSKSLIAAITLCTLVVCTAIMAQETPQGPEASPGSNAKPTLGELMARFAEIESSYLPFHIDYSESLTQKLGPFLAGVTDDEPSYEYRAERGHRDLKIWMRETTIINAGVSRTERSVTNEAGLHLKETSPAPHFFDDDGVSESAEPQVRPLEGVFPLMFHTDAPILLSQHYAAEPKEFAFIWHDKLARVWCRHRSDNGLHVQVELWLDPDFAWHPVFMRRYLIQGEPLSVGERYADEWKVTEFRKLNELVRVSAGEFSGPIRRTTKTDESREAFVRSRFRILKSTYQTRVPDLVFSPETPIGGSPIAELEPVGGEQVEVKSSEIAELSLPALTPEEIHELTAVTNQQSATEMRPADSLNPTSTALPDEIQSQIAALEAELIVQKADLGERHPTIRKLSDKITALREAGAELLGQVTVLHLKNARAKDVAEKIEQLFPDKTRNLVVDERTNSLMLRGDEKLIRDVEQIVQILDEDVPVAREQVNADLNSVPSMKTSGETLPVPATRSPFGGENSERMSAVEGSLASNPPVPIAEYRRRLADLETPVMQLAEKVRAVATSLGKDHPNAVKQRAELRALVQKTFAERQQIQRAELAEFTRRLERMRRSIETREKIAGQIVDRRVEELLNPDASWEHPLQSHGRQTEPLKMTGRLPQNFYGDWRVEQLIVKGGDVDLSSMLNPYLKITADHFEIPFDGDIRDTLAYSLLPGTPTKVDLILEPSGSRAQALGIIEITDDTFKLCFREPAEVNEPPITESDRPTTFGPESKTYFVQCRRIVTPSVSGSGENTNPDTFAVTLNRSELLPTIDAILLDIEELQNRTPLKLLLQFKDEPLLQISDDFYKSVRSLRDDVKGKQPTAKVKAAFSSAKYNCKPVVSKFSRFKSQGMTNVLREIEEGFATLEILIESDQRVGVVTNIVAGKNQVEVSVGLKDGIKTGQQLTVATGNHVIGKVEIVAVEQDSSVAMILNVPADRPIRRGDRIQIPDSESKDSTDVVTEKTVPQEKHKRQFAPLTGSHDDVNPSAPTTAAQLITKTYPVGNYVTATFFDQAVALQNPAPSLDAAADSIRQKAEELITQISSHNKPAAISFDSARLQLVVSHTAEGHRALGELFATIKLPMQEKLTFSRCEVNEQIYSAFKDSPVWTAFDEFRNEVEDGGWIGVRKNEFVKWFERVLKESPAGEDFGQPTSLVLTAGVPYQFDAGEIRVALTARINPASQKPQLRIDYADLSGRPSGTRMISDLEDLAAWIPSSEECITFLVYESAQGGSFPARDSLQKQDTAPPQPIAITPDVTEEVPGPEIVSLTLFEVSDPTFMPSEDSAPGQSLAPDKFDKQLESMLKNKTAKLIGKHTIETTGNRLATLNSGGKFEVPSSSPEKKAEVVFGTAIEITPRTLNGERVFQILWNERVRNFENDVSGIPGIDEKRIELNISSPLPGGAGYLFGPLQGNNRNRRLFVHFLLNDASSDMPPVSRHDHSMENPLNDPNAALRPRLQGVTRETTADQSFVRGEVPPTSDAEKSVGRLVLVFANDAARRMVPALMVKHGEKTLALTVGPATIVPDDTPHAIDRTFLEFYNRDHVPTEYSQELEFPDLRAYEAKESLTEFQLEKPATVELSDQLSAIINHGQADFKVTSRAAQGNRTFKWPEMLTKSS
jgi:hypothetical protein